ncbi:MAG: DUF3185 family protein [Elusimicrobia bacterium]|nr:DUF3185 family protein [Elusimicrobiota bacterium]
MNRGLSVALLAVGVVLIVYGLKASDSFGSDVSRFFTGSPTNKSIWLLIGGALSAAAGLAGLVRGSKG